MKRGRYGNALTGGTRDVNPQWYKGKVSTIVADTPETLAFISPVGKGIFAKTGWSTVMELLKVQVILPAYTDIGAAAETDKSRILTIGTRDFGTTVTLGDEPSILCYHFDALLGAFTAAGSYGIYIPNTHIYDLTDGAGHGILVATDYIYVQADTNTFGVTSTFRFALLYRFKNVPLQEYIGIVQSQQ